MAGTGPGVVVKNTFLEVGDHKSLLERSDGWRRQMSEPVKVYTESGQGQHDGTDLSESDDELLLHTAMPPPSLEPRGAVVAPQPPLSAAAVSSSMPMPEAGCTSVGAVQQTTGKPPKVLLLSESIPFKRGGEKEREKKGARDGHINQMKDNSITKKEPPWTGVTTVMMRNLPNKYTQQMLLEELQDGGFRVIHDFDFFYLPMDHSNAANLGYCFINFVETALANAFAAAFQGKKMRRFNSNKTVVVMPASVQGYERNYAYYASTRVVQAEDPQYRPLFLRPPSVGGQVPPMPAMGQARATGRGRGASKSGSSGNGGTASRETNRGGARGGSGKGISGGMPRGPDMGVIGMRAGGSDWMAAGGGIGTGWPSAVQGAAPAVQRRACPACGSECGPTHRFCAFCGSDQLALQGTAAAMRADAPSFTPSFTPGYAPTPGLGQEAGNGAASLQLTLPSQQGTNEAGAPWQALSGALHTPESGITDELDVMRGRMVLLAALRDMEERETSGSDAISRTPGAAPASRMLVQPPGAGGSIGTREDFLGVLSR